MMNKEKNIKSRIESLINNIDEFDSKFVTYKAESIKTLLQSTLQFIKRKEQEREELKNKINYMEEYIKTVENARNDLERELKAKEQELKRVKKENQYHINTYCHFKNEIKKYKKAVHKYKVVLQDKIKRLHLSRREFLKEINSVPVKIACKGENFKKILNNFNNAIQVINNEDRYKQTLDVIEEIAKKKQVASVFTMT